MNFGELEHSTSELRASENAAAGLPHTLSHPQKPSVKTHPTA